MRKDKLCEYKKEVILKERIDRKECTYCPPNGGENAKRHSTYSPHKLNKTVRVDEVQEYHDYWNQISYDE